VSVGVVDSDGLFCIHEILHNALHKYVEGTTKENFIGRQSDDVDLHVEGEAIKGERNILHKTE
jgi:hypothetical protein